MKLEKLSEHLQQQLTSCMTPLPSTSQQQHFPLNVLNYCSTKNVVPLNEQDVSQGILAVGGCRQCCKTFTDRLSLIHHFVDHFPNIFYSFEERARDNVSKLQNTQREQQFPLFTNNLPQNYLPQGINGSTQINDNHDQQMSNDEQFLGQLGMLLCKLTCFIYKLFFSALFASNPNICSQQIPTNLFSSFQMPIKNNINFSMGIPSFEGETTNNSFNFLNKEINNLNKDYLFDKKEEKAEKTGNDLKKLKDQQTNLSKKKRRANNENNKESWKFTKNEEKNEGNETNETLPQQSTTLFDLPYHMCPHCCLTFAETENYKAHLEMHQQPLHVNNGIDISNLFNSLQNDESLKQQVETKCPLCEMEFSNIFRLNEHVRLHNAHSCDICQKVITKFFTIKIFLDIYDSF